ncbi:hypothetical protein [Mesorhizobium sp. M1B.F.Ca.ET.045.04.1.1]|uniref:hypothetical protein n=1 Tax=Mesorhizobium sp. M1B.F.Ca.ET.045.04.1.1 TaxID=2493673 RepID=UPI001FE1F209|nr:hypothetical protein [Mesorhizobium sp. M1B.F.Ca.ET.045.04.1.1]
MAKATKAGFAKRAGHGRFAMRGGSDALKAKVGRSAKTGKFVVVDATRFEAVMKAAEHSGLLGEKSARIGGRISPALLEQAKKQTGIQTDTDLIEFALANVALDDDFGKTFSEVRGTVDPSLKLGF